MDEINCGQESPSASVEWPRQVIASSIAQQVGPNAGFLFLASVAAVAFGILCFFMPETLRLPSTQPKL